MVNKIGEFLFEDLVEWFDDLPILIQVGSLLSLVIVLMFVCSALSIRAQNEPIMFHVDGMPCVKIKQGISCDWSQWDGN